MVLQNISLGDLNYNDAPWLDKNSSSEHKYISRLMEESRASAHFQCWWEQLGVKPVKYCTGIMGLVVWKVSQLRKGIAWLAKESIEWYPRSMVFEELVKLIFIRLDNFSKQSENLFLLSKNTAGFEDFYFSGILHILNHCRSRQCRKKKSLGCYKFERNSRKSLRWFILLRRRYGQILLLITVIGGFSVVCEISCTHSVFPWKSQGKDHHSAWCFFSLLHWITIRDLGLLDGQWMTIHLTEVKIFEYFMSLPV